MKERPILFSGPMIRALLNGTKTQTRRMVKWRDLQPGINPSFSGLEVHSYVPGLFTLASRSRNSVESRSSATRCPHGRPGDRLWVREAHYLTDNGDEEYAVYASDCDAVREHMQRVANLPKDFPADVKARHRKLRPSIHMPRWASRIQLEITDVRVERLQAISEADSIAEGIERPEDMSHEAVEALDVWPTGAERACFNALNQPKHQYRRLWDEINGLGSWESNPWVWAITFRLIEGQQP